MYDLRYFLLFLLFFTAASHAQTALSCQPSRLGQPCSGGGLTIAASAEPSINLGVGNPIHLVTGNNYQQETDMPPNASLYGLEIIRHYNSADPESTALGLGWKLSYDTRLFKVAGRLQVIQADGSRVTFDANGLAHTKAHGHLVSNSQHHRWTWANGHILMFDPYGYLIKVSTPDDQHITILREPQAGGLQHAISKVINHTGYSLRFDYDSANGQGHLKAIHTPLGVFSYRVQPSVRSASPGQPQMLEAKRPDGIKKQYLYEADLQSGAHRALTGIVLVSADGKAKQRTNTWTYDAQGRANATVRGAPDSDKDKVSLTYVQTPNAHQDGLTVVKNAQGRESRYTTQLKNGRYVVTQVQGSPCFGCAAPGTHARYDDKGRLQEINGTQVQRDPQGRLRSLKVHNLGWPGLQLRYSHTGQRKQWEALLTGTEHTHYDPLQRPSLRQFANGDSLRYSYDAQGRPAQLQAANSSGVLPTRLSWHGQQLLRIEHPHETETRRYDAQQRISERTLYRPASGTDRAQHYTESFDYDPQHRLTHHHLPEGGTLIYHWSEHGRLTGIQWHDVLGNHHSVITTVAGRPGYRYGNGLHLETALNASHQADGLQLTDTQQPLWSQYHHYDTHGRVQQEDQHFAGTDHALRWRYAYDDQSRLTGASNGTDTRWYAWHSDGALAATKNGNDTTLPQIQRDRSGLATAVGPYQLRYGPNRRLTQVYRDNALEAQYRHNAFGHRIVSLSKHHSTYYFYLNNQLVAQAQGGTAISRRYIYAHQVLVGFIDYDTATGQPATLYAVHSDLIGAPVLVTDATRKVRWQAHYQPTGAATQVAGDLTLDLRLPGQVYDAATGWHDNVLRTYLPQWGQYLEPDPLGPLPGQQALGYAAQQPKRYIDPLGLLLFAFDGTRNDPATASNVWKISQYYQDGEVYYHSGPGNPQYLDWDAATAYQADQIIQNQWQSLLNALSATGNLTDSTPIDIIGFSRGAALARHFGNLINQSVNQGQFSYLDPQRGLVTACVDLRFMGLFDTVAQFGLAGSQNALYDLSIASAWQWVAHAVALNERRVLFPLSAAADTGGSNVIEAPFIGAHADIGGGLALNSTSSAAQADLSDVALNWMLWQARAATLRFGTIPNDDKIIVNPILHDERAPLLRSVQDSDRRVDAATGVLLHHYQDDHTRLGSAQRASAEAAILRHPNWRLQAGNEVGSVDMSGYAQWLQQELGWQALPV